MLRAFRILMVTLAVSACATPKPLVWLKTDGQYVAGSPALETQFSIDRTACDGEAQKANLSAGTNYMGGAFARAIEEGRRNQAAERVLDGCMAGKGYVHVEAAQADSIAANLAATQRERQRLTSGKGR
jgi:hypothetical protein